MTPVALLVFARCTGFAFRAPGFAHPSVPPPVRGGLALLLTIAIVPGVRATGPMPDAAMVAALVSEFVLGSAIGIAASLLYDGAYAGGRIVDDYVGVRAVAPNVQLVAPSGYGRIWSLAFTGAFFLLGAYRYTLLGFARSFAIVAPGARLDGHAWLPFAQHYAAAVIATGALVAAPAIALAFVVQVALGALTRTIPRFSGYALSFPLVFAAALVATVLALPDLASQPHAPVMLFPGSLP